MNIQSLKHHLNLNHQRRRSVLLHQRFISSLINLAVFNTPHYVFSRVQHRVFIAPSIVISSGDLLCYALFTDYIPVYTFMHARSPVFMRGFFFYAGGHDVSISKVF